PVLEVLLAEGAPERLGLDAADDRDDRLGDVICPAALSIDYQRPTPEHLEPAGHLAAACRGVAIEAAEPASKLVTDDEETARVLPQQLLERLDGAVVSPAPCRGRRSGLFRRRAVVRLVVAPR